MIPKTGARVAGVHIRRFLLSFDPLGFTVVWDKNGLRKSTALRVDPEELTDLSSQKRFAHRLVRKYHDFLEERHTAQVEALLQRLAQRVLPIYCVKSSEALGTGDAAGSSRAVREGSLTLPAGVFFLVVERTRCADGWWLRLASGKKWVPETWNGREACVKCSPSASDALESLRHIRFARANSGVLERNARLVCAQIAKQSATAAK